MFDKDAEMQEGRCRVSTRGDWRVIQAMPIYPRSAMADRIEGYSLLEHQISEDGKATGITVVESYPEGVFDRAAISALDKWHFEYIGEASPDRRQRYLRKISFKL